MRPLPILLLLQALTLPLAAWAADPPAACPPLAHPARLTWQQHFAAANLAHDGHLTKDEANAGFPLLARHFDEVDADHKGYVTVDDIRAWRAAQKTAHRPAIPAADKPRPRSAVQRTDPDLRPIPVAHTQASAIPVPPLAP
jgi:hypothetical protein